MNRNFVCLSAAVFFCTHIFAHQARGDTFGSGANSFDIDFVTVGNPGNPPDANGLGLGSVPYIYRIGKYEISEQMIDKANALGGLGVTKDTRGPDYPATRISWFEAAKFVNWLNTSTGNSPAYKFDANGNFQLWQATDQGYDSLNLYRNKFAKYVLPTANEWRKSAYYDPSAGVYYIYPTGSNNVPDGVDFPGDPVFDAVFFDGATSGGPNTIFNSGLPSRYGTFAQGGNAAEWVETAFDSVNNATSEGRTFLGGGWGDASTLLADWNTSGAIPADESVTRGFRVAVVPEPGLSVSMVVLLLIYLADTCRSKQIR